jgi:hypothetical protein
LSSRLVGPTLVRINCRPGLLQKLENFGTALGDSCKSAARDFDTASRLSFRSTTHLTTMAMSCRYAAQTCARQLRSTPSARATARLVRASTTTRRYNSTEAAAAVNPKIESIVDQISQLTLLETADLVSTLKVSLI